MENETRVINTTELCRSFWGTDKDSFKTFMVQTYNDKPNFYYIQHGTYKATPIETANDNIEEIINHLQKCLETDKKALKKETNTVVREIRLDLIEKEEIFIDKIIQLKIN